MLVVLGVGVPVALVFTLNAGGADPGCALPGAGKLRQAIGQHAGGVERTFHREGAGRAMHLPVEAGERVLTGVHRRTERTHDVIADAPAAVHQTGVDGRQRGVELTCTVDDSLRGTRKAGCRGAAGAGQVGNDFLAGVVQVCGPEEPGGVVGVGKLPLNAAGLDQRVPPGLDVVVVAGQQDGPVQGRGAGDLQRIADGDCGGRLRAGRVIAPQLTTKRNVGAAVDDHAGRGVAAEAQPAVVDDGVAGVGVCARQQQSATAFLGQPFLAADVVAEGVVLAVVDVGVEVPVELRRAVDRLVCVHETPAKDVIDALFAQVGGSGEQGVLDVVAGHPGIGARDERGDAGDQAGRHGSALCSVGELRAVQLGNDRRARRGDAPRCSDAACVGIVGLAGRRAVGVDRDSGHGHPVVLKLREQVRGARRVAGSVLGVVASGEDAKSVDLQHLAHAECPRLRRLHCAVGIVLVGAANRQAEDVHALRHEFIHGTAGRIGPAAITAADTAPIELGVRGDAALEVAVLAADDGRGDYRPVAALIVRLRLGRSRLIRVVLVERHAPFERGVVLVQRVVQHGDLRALAGVPRGVRQVGVGADEHVVHRAGVGRAGRIDRLRLRIVTAGVRTRIGLFVARVRARVGVFITRVRAGVRIGGRRGRGLGSDVLTTTTATSAAGGEHQGGSNGSREEVVSCGH